MDIRKSFPVLREVERTIKLEDLTGLISYGRVNGEVIGFACMVLQMVNTAIEQKDYDFLFGGESSLPRFAELLNTDIEELRETIKSKGNINV